MDTYTELHALELSDELRKSLIKSCLLQALLINAKTAPAAKEIPAKTPTLSPHKDWSTGPHSETLKKLHEYERRLFVLKMELATKQQAHEAKVHLLNDVIDRLQARMDAADIAKTRGTVGRPRTAPETASLSATARPSLAREIADVSPFPTEKRLGLFGRADFAQLASNATLKLSKEKEPEQKAGDVLSPNISSAESTPLRSSKRPDLNLSSSSLAAASETDDTLHSDSSTFDGAEKKKKRIIKLLSSQASKVPSSQAPHDSADKNSLDYYLDPNFEENPVVQPEPARVLEDDLEPPAKKRHVFKI